MTDAEANQPANLPPPSGNPPQKSEPVPSSDLYDFLKNEITHRRGRRQQIFSWVSSLLVGIAGGTIGLTYAKGAVLGRSQKKVLTWAIFILFSFSWLWISHHWQEEIAVREKLRLYFNPIARPGEDRPYREDWTTILAVFLLAVAACFAVWLNP
jgi:hypothetical protein